MTRGRVELRTKAGDLQVGIHEGAAAWLDVKSKAGAVRNELNNADRSGEHTETVAVHARTSLGDITICRAVVTHGDDPGTEPHSR